MEKKVLIIDDDRDFTEEVSNLLDAKGYCALSAQNSDDGFNRARADRPDLILLDVMMTKRTEGFRVSRDLKADNATKDIPVVVVTGIRRDMSLPFRLTPDSDWLPVQAVLEKPVKSEVLLKAIEDNIK